MLKLPNREHLLDKGTKSIVFLGLADILYAWCYNHRITWGENSVESAWNIAKLSSTLSWLDVSMQFYKEAIFFFHFMNSYVDGSGPIVEIYSDASGYILCLPLFIPYFFTCFQYFPNTVWHFAGNRVFCIHFMSRIPDYFPS